MKFLPKLQDFRGEEAVSAASSRFCRQISAGVHEFACTRSGRVLP